MRHKRSFWVVSALVCIAWIGVNLSYQGHVQARQAIAWRPPSLQNQECTTGPDLQIQHISVDPNPPGIGQSYNIHVEIVNAGTVTVTAGSWTFLYVDRAPPSVVPPDPPPSPDVQAFAATEGLGTGATPITAHFTVSGTNAFAGWHTVSVIIDALNGVDESACNGEENNRGAISFEILQVYTPSPTPTTPPTPTSPPSPTAFPKPTIYSFDPEDDTIDPGESVTLRWQVYGQSVSVYLDGELVPLEDSRVVYPTNSHIYTLRAQNPGGYVEAKSNIKVVGSTPTPTLTPTACPRATINEFGAAPSSIIRGATTILYWDVSGADKVFLNGESVPSVSSRTVQLNQTTVYTLVSRNRCGDNEKVLTVQVSFATPTPTLTRTTTLTPTSTPTPTYTPQPTYTPTRRVLPTPTLTSATGPVTGTVTLTPAATRTLSPFESPLQTPTVLATSTATETLTATATLTATSTPSATAMSRQISPTTQVTTTTQPTATLTATSTPSATATSRQISPTAQVTTTTQPTATLTAVPALASPTVLPTPLPATGRLRMYLCPLGVLIAFAVGVLMVAVVWPRIRDRQSGGEPYSPELGDVFFDPDELPAGEDPPFERPSDSPDAREWSSAGSTRGTDTP